jgi:hypothetical protein
VAPPDPDTVDLRGLVLPDARTGTPVDLGTTPALGVLTVIRHRH